MKITSGEVSKSMNSSVNLQYTLLCIKSKESYKVYVINAVDRDHVVTVTQEFEI